MVHVHRSSQCLLLSPSGRRLSRYLLIHILRAADEVHQTATRLCSLPRDFQSGPQRCVVHVSPPRRGHAGPICRRQPPHVCRPRRSYCIIWRTQGLKSAKLNYKWRGNSFRFWAEISQKGSRLSPQHKSTILHHPRPQSVKDMLSFLGLTGYSRNYVPDYSGLTKPLRDMV